MVETLLLPFSYGFMTNAMWVSALVEGVCTFLSAYLMLKGWSLHRRCTVPFHCAGCCADLHDRPTSCRSVHFFQVDSLQVQCCFLSSGRH